MSYRSHSCSGTFTTADGEAFAMFAVFFSLMLCIILFVCYFGPVTARAQELMNEWIQYNIRLLCVDITQLNTKDIGLIQNTIQYINQSRELSINTSLWSAWLSDRTSVSDQRSFAVLRSTCSWWVTTYVGNPSAIGQPTRPTQPFILSTSINE